MNVNDIVYIILNGSIVTQVEILKKSGNLYTIKVLDSNKVIRLSKHRLFKTEEAALNEVPKHLKSSVNNSKGNMIPPLH